MKKLSPVRKGLELACFFFVLFSVLLMVAGLVKGIRKEV